MAELRLITLGRVRVLMGERDITLEVPVKIVALLVYLARSQHPKPREALAEFFWPDRTAQQAFGSLRTAISKSRAVLGDALISDYSEVRVQAWLDANEFEHTLDQNPTHALKLYEGDFMPSFFVKDARDFESWQLREQEKLHEKFVQSTLTLAKSEATLQPQNAITRLQNALSLAPIREELHHALVALHHQSGNRTLAIKQYETYRKMLWEEYGVEPDATAQALYATLETSVTVVSTTETRLPSRLSSFVGRDDSLKQVQELLMSHRLLTITARGGAGKTRLAVELAYRVKDHFADGVYFIDLSKLDDAEQVVSFVAQELGMMREGDDPLAQVTAYLQKRNLLMVLDNFEQVLPASHALAHWLKHTPNTRFLVTSRESLKLYGEQLYQLPALSLQEACQLFYERVRAVCSDFQRDEANDASIRQVCQHLEGLPLAIELAATHARTLSFDEILQGLQHRLELLVSDLRYVPARQRTLFHTIDWSYALLTPQQRALFRHLAVFKGGWVQGAVLAVSPHASELNRLVEKHLVRRAVFGTSRYTMLESIREYAQYQLENNDEMASLQEAHARWVCDFSEANTLAFRTNQQLKVFNNIKQEEENVRACLEYLAKRPDLVELYARILGALGWIWNIMNIAEEPFAHTKRAIALAQQLPKAIYAPLLVSGGHSAYALGHHELSQMWHTQALHIFEELGDALQVEYTRFFIVGQMMGVKDAILRLYDIRKRALQLDDSYLLSMVNINLGSLLANFGEHHQSLFIVEEGLNICETHHYHLQTPIYYINLADVKYSTGHLAHALQLVEKACTVSESNGILFIQAYSLFEACKMYYSIGELNALALKLERAEPLVKALFSPSLLARFYFWRAVLAEQQKDVVQFYSAYTQIFRYLNPRHNNMWEYVVNVLLYASYLAIQNGETERATVLLQGANYYAHTLEMPYYPYQLLWRDEALEQLKATVSISNLPTTPPDITDLLATAQGILDVMFLG